MQTLQQLQQQDPGWAEWTDLEPSRIAGRLWGVPFRTRFSDPLEPVGMREIEGEDGRRVIEAIRIIDAAMAWSHWYSEAKRLCQQAD